MPTILPNNRGHHPRGSAASGVYDPDNNLESTGPDAPDLDLIKAELESVQSSATWYHSRNSCALDWWQSRWDGQTVDGRKWPQSGNAPETVFPWVGASDTRTRTVKMIINEHRTVGMYAVMNMKLQAKSSRPTANARASQQATTLLNWMLFTKLQAELHRELPLAMAWRNGYGASILAVDWEQERRLESISINTVQFTQWIGMLTGQPFGILDLQEILSDPAQEKELVTLIQAMSPILSRAKARKILRDLQDLRTADVPVPYVYRSQPRITALRPMVDVFFDPAADDLQRERWVDRVEWVSETDLRDRIETEGYDPGFVDLAVEQRGADMAGPWGIQTGRERGDYGSGFGSTSTITSTSTSGGEEEKRIELHHFYWKALDMGVPVLYRTVFHRNVDVPASHGPCEYAHGAMPFHALRFETDHRPILSSMGIAEVAYTWEQELKVQLDGRTDRTSLALTPPLFADYHKVLEMKAAFMPRAIIPIRRGDEPRFATPPAYDPGSIQITQDVMARIDRYFGLFGAAVDPELKQLRRMELGDAILTELKPAVMQIWQLLQQYEPDEMVSRVVGPLARPFQVAREEIQGQFELTATVDLRELDNDFLKQKLGFIAQLKQMDTGGVLDSNALIRLGAEAIDYSIADQAIQNTDTATNKEINEEIGTVNRIVGSGMPEPLPQGGNYQLRMQTLQNQLQSAHPSNPNLQRQDVQEVLKNRLEFFQRQLQQLENAQIGRLQVTSPFSKAAPQISQGAPA